MIILNEIAKKVENILNGVDSETSSYLRPSDYEYKVATSGFHLDHIYDKASGKNFIPVFITAMGGSYDPVIGIKRSTYNVSITLYFPVSFKNDFYALNDFLVNCFVGTTRNYGTVSGRCLSNMSVPEYGEIQDLDLTQFKTWAENIYAKPIDIMQPYMSMTFVLYLTSAESGVIYGNDVSYTLSARLPYYEITAIKGDGLYNHYYERYPDGDQEIALTTYYAWKYQATTIYTKTETPDVGNDFYSIIVISVQKLGEIAETKREIGGYDTYSTDLKWVSSGTGADNSPISQQLINQDKYARNVINITNYSKSVMVYYENNDFWNKILDIYNLQEISELENVTLNKTYKIGNTQKTYTYNQVVLSINENAQLGDLLTFTITFGDKVE